MVVITVVDVVVTPSSLEVKFGLVLFFRPASLESPFSISTGEALELRGRLLCDDKDAAGLSLTEPLLFGVT